jgi:hypothetical protein
MKKKSKKEAPTTNSIPLVPLKEELPGQVMCYCPECQTPFRRNTMFGVPVTVVHQLVLEAVKSGRISKGGWSVNPDMSIVVKETCQQVDDVNDVNLDI